MMKRLVYICRERAFGHCNEWPTTSAMGYSSHCQGKVHRRKETGRSTSYRIRQGLSFNALTYKSLWGIFGTTGGLGTTLKAPL